MLHVGEVEGLFHTIADLNGNDPSLLDQIINPKLSLCRVCDAQVAFPSGDKTIEAMLQAPSTWSRSSMPSIRYKML